MHIYELFVQLLLYLNISLNMSFGLRGSQLSKFQINRWLMKHPVAKGALLSYNSGKCPVWIIDTDVFTMMCLLPSNNIISTLVWM